MNISAVEYMETMDDIFMRELGIKGDVFRVSDSHRKILHGLKTGHMLAGVEEILIREKPAIIEGQPPWEGLCGNWHK